MALDERYRWVVAEGVHGPDGRPKKIGLGFDDGRFVIDTRGLAVLDDDALDVLAASVEAARTVVRQLRQGRS
jgi:hypothetical protein